MLGELPLAVKFVIAFLVVLGLIGGAAFAVRRFGVSGLATAAVRGRQPRLAVIDSASVDARRRLLLIRRDNVEHLLMIGGPNDVLVETAIVRAAGATTRDPPAPRPTVDPAASPELSGLPTTDPAPRQSRAAAEDRAPSLDFPPRRVERSVEPTEPSRLAPRAESASSRVFPAPEPAGPRLPAAPQPILDITPEPARDAAPELGAEERNIAEMAQRLEAALRRSPAAEPLSPKQTEPLMRSPGPSAADLMAPSRGGKATPSEAPVEIVTEPPKRARAIDSLEQEMASLLGRPSTKT